MLITLSRDELYSLVWRKPLRELAKDYGVSDVWVAQICRRMEIPLPGRGYWAKMVHGKKSSPVSLKRPSDKCQKTIRFDTDHQRRRSEVSVQAKEALVEEITQSISLKRLTLPLCKIISEAKSQLQNAKANELGILEVKLSPYIDVRIGRGCIERCTELLNVMFAVLEEKKLSFLIEKDERDGKSKSYMCRGEDRIQFHIEEELDATPHILTDAEKKKVARKEFLWGRFGNYPREYHLMSWEPPKYDYHLSGRLLLKINNISSSGLRQKWYDKEGQPLEKSLPKIIWGFLAAADYLANKRIEQERYQQAWIKQEQQREEFLQNEQLEEERCQRLRRILKRRSEQKELLELVMYIESEVPFDRRTKTFNEWLDWIRNYIAIQKAILEDDAFNHFLV